MDPLSNLPPGMRDSDIPGNRPIDIAWNSYMEAFYQRLDEASPEQRGEMVAYAMDLMDRLVSQRLIARNGNFLLEALAIGLGMVSFEEWFYNRRGTDA